MRDELQLSCDINQITFPDYTALVVSQTAVISAEVVECGGPRGLCGMKMKFVSKDKSNHRFLFTAKKKY